MDSQAGPTIDPYDEVQSRCMVSSRVRTTHRIFSYTGCAL